MANESSGEYSFSFRSPRTMRVIITAEDGTMQSLWLPEDGQGRYRFFSSADDMNLSLLYFERIGSTWYVFCPKDGYFKREQERTEGPLSLESGNYSKVYLNGHEYNMFYEQVQEQGNVFHPYLLNKAYTITIGRSNSSDIQYRFERVSRAHAELFYSGGRWNVRDSESKNKVYLNGRQVIESGLEAGDIICIMGLRILMGKDFISINDEHPLIHVSSAALRRIHNGENTPYAPAYGSSADTVIKREPRRKLNIETTPIEIDMPPYSLNDEGIPLLLRMGSPMVMGGKALMSGNIAMMLTSMLFPLLTTRYTEKERKEYEQRRTERYTEYLGQIRSAIQHRKLHEEYVLQSRHLSLESSLKLVDERKQLWTRTITDDLFLKIRIGQGRLPLNSEIEYQPRKFEMDPDPLMDKMYAVAEEPVYLEDVPICTCLAEECLIGIQLKRSARLRLVQTMLMQIAIHHSYEDVKIIILAAHEDMQQLEFASYLPHCWSDQMDFRFIAENKADAGRISEYLTARIDPYFSSQNNLQTILRENPFYVVFCLDKGLFDSVEPFKRVEHTESCKGISIIAAYDGFPLECTKLLRAADGDCILEDLQDPTVPDQKYIPDSLDYAKLRRSARQLSHLRLSGGQKSLFLLPKKLSFLEMYGVGRVEHLAPLKRWQENNPGKSLAAPVGVGADGELFYLDLHEKFQGPHGLVAGMTGSGKSEFIITYILSMAVNYSPEEVAFILIDYKGGGLAGAFEDRQKGIRLPHLVGTITNLDGASIQRSLMSINSELKRRQRLFNEAKNANNGGTVDIYTYQSLYRAKKLTAPLPHLFIISDEFAELKQQQPDFMEELISTARIGRSLGVHLILATQKPSGVVNDQIWSNSKFRVCLRVQDKSDSNEMLKRPEAAALKDVGRFYLQVGYNEFFALGQSAWCGADYEPSDEIQRSVDHSVSFLDMTGQSYLSLQPAHSRRKNAEKQIASVVRLLSELTNQTHLKTRQLWMDALSPQVELQQMKRSPEAEGVNSITATVGIVDDPENQQQFPLRINLQACRNLAVVGDSGSGKSTFLLTLLYDLICHYSPEYFQFAAVDFSGGALSPLKDAPHCMAYLTEDDEDSLARLLAMLTGIVEQRKASFKEMNVSSFDSFCQVRRIPLILLVIDNFALFAASKNNQFYNNFHTFMRDSISYGIKVVTTCSRLNEMSSRCRQEIQDRVALHLKDRYDYFDVLNVKTPYVPTDTGGRGMCVQDGRALEFQTAQFGTDLNGQERAVRYAKAIARITSARNDTPAERLPMMKSDESYRDFCAGIEAARIPLGYSGDIKKISIPLQQLYCMSLYFGNPRGIAPVMQNLLYAAKRDHMLVFFVKRAGESIADASFVVQNQEVEFIDCTAEKLDALLVRINSEVLERKQHRNKYCEQEGLPVQAVESMQKAAPYIRAHTVPLLIIFERYLDFCKAASDSCLKNFPVIYQMGKGYNFYFMGGFYPEDGNAVSTEMLAQSFVKRDDFLLLFGGQFSKQPLDPALPSEYRRSVKPIPEYNKLLMKYRGSYHKLVMPCGELILHGDGSDDDDII